MSMNDNPDVNWEEVKNRAARMVKEYNIEKVIKKIPNSGQFYESRLG